MARSGSRKILPLPAWPAADQADWDALFAEGDLLDGAGPARHWRPATRRTNAQHYGRWLGWLARTEALDPACLPADRIRPDRVEAYARDLLATLAPRTTASALIGLTCVAKVLAPTGDWRWLMDLTNRLHLRAKPSIDRRGAMRPAGEIFAAAEAEFARLAATPLRSRRDRVALRDMAMVLILAACPIRFGNLAGLALGRHLRRAGARWEIHIPEEESKTGQRLAHELPARATGPIDLYLERARLSFSPAADCPAVWIGIEGQPLTPHSVYGRVVLATGRLFGTPINPHLFRSCAATSLVEEAPEAAYLAAPLLGHRYFSTTERYYVRAGQVAASRKINGLLAALAAGDTED